MWGFVLEMHTTFISFVNRLSTMDRPNPDEPPITTAVFMPSWENRLNYSSAKAIVEQVISDLVVVLPS